MYTITFSPEAEADLAKLKRSEPTSFKKVVKLLNELVVHPRKHRLVYRIFETEVHVDVLSAYGHYDDK